MPRRNKGNVKSNQRLSDLITIIELKIYIIILQIYNKGYFELASSKVRYHDGGEFSMFLVLNLTKDCVV